MTSAAAMRAEPPARAEVVPVREAVEEPGCVEVARAGGVDHAAGHRLGVDHVHLVAAHHDRALRARA